MKCKFKVIKIVLFSLCVISVLGIANLSAAETNDTWVQFSGNETFGVNKYHNAEIRPKTNSTSAWFIPINSWGGEQWYSLGVRYESGAAPWKGDLRTFYAPYGRTGKYIPNLIMESNGYNATKVRLHFRGSGWAWGVGGGWSPDSV